MSKNRGTCDGAREICCQIRNGDRAPRARSRLRLTV
jgi:hypothetical protein